MNVLSMQKFRVSLFAAVIALLPLSLASHAQGSQTFGRYNVPFAFDAGSHHFAPGLYTFHLEATNIVSIRGASGEWFTLMMPDDASRPSSTSKLVFMKDHEGYSLFQIWTNGDSLHWQRFVPKAKKRLNLAKGTAAPDDVEVALLANPR